MVKSEFLNIIMMNDPVEINKYILSKGKTKPVAAVRFLKNKNKEESK